ncbi:hypothetical protein S40293_11493 [Stachybotrys chartarum IBT 40293]|nr:hypothetical protein S40293_11493 [Stachybotrys chartarum IBT 40293]
MKNADACQRTRRTTWDVTLLIVTKPDTRTYKDSEKMAFQSDRFSCCCGGSPWKCHAHACPPRHSRILRGLTYCYKPFRRALRLIDGSHSSFLVGSLGTVRPSLSVSGIISLIHHMELNRGVE